VLPAEALAFAKWAGEGFRLPTLEEWRKIYLELALSNYSSTELDALLAPGDTRGRCLSEDAREVLTALLAESGPCSLFRLTLLDGGVVEWVQRSDRWTGLGCPRPEFQPHLWNPLDNDVVPLREDERVKYFGFRLVRRGRRGGAAEERGR